MRFNINGKDIKIHNARIKSITTGMEQRLVNRVKLEFDSTKELNQYEKTKIKAAIENAINQNAEPISKEFARFITKAIASHLSEMQIELPSMVYEDIECTLMKGNFSKVETFVRNYIQNNRKSIMNEKYYYELSKGDEILYCSVDAPIKEEKLPELICMPDYTARQITKEEYDREANNEFC